jgi:hypothetical protein
VFLTADGVGEEGGLDGKAAAGAASGGEAELADTDEDPSHVHPLESATEVRRAYAATLEQQQASLHARQKAFTLSLAENRRIRVLVSTDGVAPVPSVADIWPSATWAVWVALLPSASVFP